MQPNTELEFILSLTEPDAVDSCMGKNHSSVPLPTNQSSGVSKTQIHTVRQQFNISHQHTVSAFPPFSSYLFQVECLLQLEQVAPLDKDSNDEINAFSQTFCGSVQKTNLH